jgi:addiction module RelE/StbE family toxin
LSARAIAWTTRAVRRLDLIGDHIARDNPKAAASVVARIVTAVDALALHPAMGRPGRLAGTRELVVPALPYLIAYRVTAKTVDILTVMHAAQQWPEKL